LSDTEKQEMTIDEAILLAHQHIKAGNYRVAEMALHDILKIAPDHFESSYFLGLSSYYMGNALKAIEILDGISKHENATAEYWCNFGIILDQSDKHKEALNAFDEAIKMDGDYSDPHWNKANALFRAANFTEAEKAARIAIEIDPEIPESWLNLGAAIVELDRPEEAIECWEKAIELRPEFSLAWSNIGNLMRNLGRIKESKEKCYGALEHDHQNTQAINNLANCYLDEGNNKKAEELYRRAISLQPNYAEAHNNLAVCLISQFRYEEAAMQARYATYFKPDYTDAYINQSSALRSIGQIEEAKKSIEQAVILSPDSAEVHMDIADILLMQDHYGDAEIELQKASELEPDTPRVYIKLSYVQERANKIEEAIKTVDRAVELNPEMPEAYIRKGQIYHLANKIEKAEKSYKKAMEMQSASPALYVSMAELYQTKGDVEKSRSYIEKAKSISKNVPGIYLCLSKINKFTEGDEDFKSMLKMENTIEDRGFDQASALNFALFSAYEDIGNYDKAFEHLKKGNDYNRKTIPYQYDQQEEIFNNTKKYCTSDLLKRLEGKGSNKDLPIFILGMPRSGTTLTEQIISSHPEVYGGGEIGVAENRFELVSEDNCSKLGEDYIKRIKKFDLTGKAARITDKMPGNFMRIGQIVAILPNAKIIHCRRNAIDTCLSCYKQSFSRGQYWSYNLEELAAYYKLYEDIMAHWRKICPDKFLEIDYEETVTNFEEQARKLISFVELDWNDACLEPHKQKRSVLTASKTQVIKPVYKSSVEAWKRYEKQLQPLIKGLK